MFCFWANLTPTRTNKERHYQLIKTTRTQPGSSCDDDGRRRTIRMEASLSATEATTAITPTEETKATTTTNKHLSFPPEGYVCKLCHQPGHWLQQCSEYKQQKQQQQKKKNNKKKKHKDGTVHVPVPGVDPSRDDIDAAKRLQQLPPPLCLCKVKSRLKKVKRSFATTATIPPPTSGTFTGYVEPDYEHSRAIGHYFFFCAKPKKDPTKCRFARPVEQDSHAATRSSPNTHQKKKHAHDEFFSTKRIQDKQKKKKQKR